VKFADGLVQNVQAPEQRQRAQKNRELIDQYYSAAKEIVPLKTEIMALQSNSTVDAASRIAALTA